MLKIYAYHDFPRRRYLAKEGQREEASNGRGKCSALNVRRCHIFFYGQFLQYGCGTSGTKDAR